MAPLGTGIAWAAPPQAVSQDTSQSSTDGGEQSQPDAALMAVLVAAGVVSGLLIFSCAAKCAIDRCFFNKRRTGRRGNSQQNRSMSADTQRGSRNLGDTVPKPETVRMGAVNRVLVADAVVRPEKRVKSHTGFIQHHGEDDADG